MHFHKSRIICTLGITSGSYHLSSMPLTLCFLVLVTNSLLIQNGRISMFDLLACIYFHFFSSLDCFKLDKRQYCVSFYPFHGTVLNLSIISFSELDHNSIIILTNDCPKLYLVGFSVKSILKDLASIYWKITLCSNDLYIRYLISYYQIQSICLC